MLSHVQQFAEILQLGGTCKIESSPHTGTVNFCGCGIYHLYYKVEYIPHIPKVMAMTLFKGYQQKYSKGPSKKVKVKNYDINGEKRAKM